MNELLVHRDHTRNLSPSGTVEFHSTTEAIGTYDPKKGTLFIAGGGTRPWGARFRGPGGGSAQQGPSTT